MRNRSAAWIICVAISATFQSLVQAQPVQYSNVPFAITPINPCNGEIVAVNGTMDILVQMTDDGAGGTHDKGYIVSKGDGLGSAGNEYVYSDEREAELSTSGPSDQSSFSFEINHMLNAVGAAPNFVAHSTVHVTVDANGVPTANVANVWQECRG